MSIILSSYQPYDEQQFQTLSCALYTIVPVLKLDLVLRALLLDYVLALEKIRVRLAFILFSTFLNIFELFELFQTFLNIFKTKYTTKTTSVSHSVL